MALPRLPYCLSVLLSKRTILHASGRQGELQREHERDGALVVQETCCVDHLASTLISVHARSITSNMFPALPQGFALLAVHHVVHTHILYMYCSLYDTYYDT